MMDGTGKRSAAARQELLRAVPVSRALTAVVVAAFPNPGAYPLPAAAAQRRVAEKLSELLPRQVQEIVFAHPLQFRQRPERLVSRNGCPAVVRTSPLAQVAAEQPAVEVFVAVLAFFDCPARDAAVGVDLSSRKDRTRRAGVDAGPALSASVAGVGRVGLQLGRRDDFTEQDERAEIGVYEQRVAADPAQPGFCRPRFFEQGSRIDERAYGGSGNQLAQVVGQLVQHLPDRQVVVSRMGV